MQHRAVLPDDRLRESNEFRESYYTGGTLTHTREATMPEKPLPTEKEVMSWIRERRNWGRWGKDDQQGVIDLVTPAKRAAAARLVTAAAASRSAARSPRSPARTTRCPRTTT